MAKIFEELFTLNLNKIAVNVWYVSSTTPVVLHAGLNDQLGRMQMNKQYKKALLSSVFLLPKRNMT